MIISHFKNTVRRNASISFISNAYNCGMQKVRHVLLAGLIWMKKLLVAIDYEMIGLVSRVLQYTKGHDSF